MVDVTSLYNYDWDFLQALIFVLKLIVEKNSEKCASSIIWLFNTVKAAPHECVIRTDQP